MTPEELQAIKTRMESGIANEAEFVRAARGDVSTLVAEVERLTREQNTLRTQIKNYEKAQAADLEQQKRQADYHKWELDTLSAARDTAIRERDAARARNATQQERIKQLERGFERVIYYLELGREEQAKNAALSAVEEPI